MHGFIIRFGVATLAPLGLGLNSMGALGGRCRRRKRVLPFHFMVSPCRYRRLAKAEQKPQ